MIKALQLQYLQGMHPAPCIVGTAHCRTLELYRYATLTYAEAMARFGTDKPDLRHGLELVDISDLVADSGFDVFVSALGTQGQIKGVCAPGCAAYCRRQLDELQEIARGGGARGVMFITIVEKRQLRTSLSRYLGAEQLAAIVGRLGGEPGDLVVLVADQPAVVAASLDKIRRELGHRFKLAAPDLLAFAWVVDFPMFELNADEGRWEAKHHPFCIANPEDLAMLEVAPGEVRAAAYDLVCNGYELASGSIRVHDRAVQQHLFQVLGYQPEEIEQRFGHLLEAFDYGAPPMGVLPLGSTVL